jgi:hypothetical protein
VPELWDGGAGERIVAVLRAVECGAATATRSGGSAAADLTAVGVG